MQAFRIHEGGEGRFEQAPDPEAGSGRVVVELRAAALNRRDILVRNPPGPAYDFPKPFVAGHDGAGVRRDTGEEVVVYPAVDWGPADDLPGALRWLGGPLDGTFAELVAVPAENVFPKPERLSFEEAASLPVAGMTAYRAWRSEYDAGAPGEVPPPPLEPQPLARVRASRPAVRAWKHGRIRGCMIPLGWRVGGSATRGNASPRLL